MRVTAVLIGLGILTLACGGEPAAPTGAQQVRTDPDFYAPFLISQAMRVDNLLFVSGQAALDETGAIVGVGDFDAQAAQTFRNLRAVLRAGGSDLDRVVKVNIYLTDMGNFPKILELRKEHFSEPYPADTIVEVGALGLAELMIEIEAVAIVEGAVTR